MTEEVKEGTIRVVEWLINEEAEDRLHPSNIRWRLDQYLDGQWVEIPAFHLDRDGNLKEGRIYPMEARQ